MKKIIETYWHTEDIMKLTNLENNGVYENSNKKDNVTETDSEETNNSNIRKCSARHCSNVCDGSPILSFKFPKDQEQ